MPSTARPAVDERGLAASAAPWRTRAGLGRRHRRDRAGRADGAGAAAAAAVGTASGMGGARALREAAAPGELRLAAGQVDRLRPAVRAARRHRGRAAGRPGYADRDTRVRAAAGLRRLVAVAASGEPAHARPATGPEPRRGRPLAYQWPRHWRRCRA